jgi:outer membrane protein assembly factor BamB
MRRRLFLASTALSAADWPGFRGPARTGVSAETGLLKQWPEQGPKLLWRRDDIHDGYGTVAAAGDRLFLVSNEGMADEFAQCLDAATGARRWRVRLGAVGNPNQQPPYPMARSTPSVEDGRVYAFSSDGDLVALRAATGDVLWRRNVRKEFGGVPGTWGYAESPLIDGDRLIITPGGAEATLLAVNKHTGESLWRSAVPGGDRAAYSSAIVTAAAGRRQYVQFLDKGVVGVDAGTGTFLWRYTGTAGGPANIASPVAKGNYVYSTNARRFNGGLIQLTAAAGGVQAEQVYLIREMPNSLGGQVLVGETLYGTNPEGPVAADFQTGRIHWAEGNSGPGAVVAAEGRLYFHFESGEVALAEATPAGYREQGRFTPPDRPRRREARERSWAYPVVANGRLYLRDLNCLWAYDVRAV